MSPRTSEHSALWTLLVIISATVYQVDSQARVCYFGPQPDAGPNTTDSLHWMKKILQEVRQRCLKRAFMLCASERQAYATIESTNGCMNPEPLGLADGSIPNEHFRASSHFGSFLASNARLNQNSYWLPSSFGDSWIEVYLNNITLVSGVITQGSGDGCEKRVTKYKVKYQTLLSRSSVYVTDGKGSIQVFNGNIDDATAPVTNFFHNSIIAIVVRLEPVEWSRGVAFRFELLGCDLS